MYEDMERFLGFREFVRARGPALSRTAFLLTGDHQLAEDLVQTALARTVPHWRRVVAGGDPEAYVRQVMVNERTAWWRRRRYDVIALVPDAPSPIDEAGQSIERLALLAALARLSPRQRAVIVLRFYEDLSVQETAEMLGCSPGTVKSTTSDALARLRTLTLDVPEVR
jgi:RNA polymerase sigma-70 factor (sigma-E family)